MEAERYFPNYEKYKMCLYPYKCEATVSDHKLNKIKKKDAQAVTVAGATITAYLPKGITAIGAAAMWNKGISGAGVLVGVIDTGIGTHPDLTGKVVVRRSYTGEAGGPVHTHGTHVAGTIAANGGIRGVAYGAMLADYRVLNNSGNGNYSWIVSAIYDAVKDGCNVISMSLGGPADYPPLRAAIQHAVNYGVPVIVAAGNSGDGNNNTDEYSYPAMYPTTQSIGAADYNGAATKPTYFTNSNYEVDCCAQGLNVLSCNLSGGYIYMSGTSMATPHISGAAALIIQQYRNSGMQYTAAMVYDSILAVSKDIFLPGRDNSTGKGFVTFNPVL